MVQHRDDTTKTLVRTRCKRDLQRLVELAPGLIRIQHTPDADYPWRIVVSRGWWDAVAAVLQREIDYPNFKDAVSQTNPQRAATYHEVWETLHAIEGEE